MTRLLAILLFFCSPYFLLAQNSAIWGLSNKGVFKTDTEYENPEVLSSLSLKNIELKYFPVRTSFIKYYPNYGLVLVSNSNGTFELDPNTGGLAKINDLQISSATTVINGSFYFAAQNEGIYEFFLESKKEELVIKYPSYGVAITRGPDGVIYGTNQGYRAGVGYSGIIFSLYPESSTVNTLFEFSSGSSRGAIIYSKQQGALFGIKSRSNDNKGSSGAELFIYSLVDSKLSTRVLDGNESYGGLVAHNDLYYGTVTNGGKYGKGYVFSYDALRKRVNEIYSFRGNTSGAFPVGPLKVNDKGELYGVCLSGGAKVTHPYLDYDGGILYTLNSSNQFTKKASLENVFNILKGFSPSNGAFIKQYEVVDIIEMPSSISVNQITAKSCGKDYELNGVKYSTTGFYVQKQLNAKGGDSLIVMDLFVSKLAGDINCNGIYDENEVAGDVNNNGKIDFEEFCGDVNGDGEISLDELLGDKNGDYNIGYAEISGDKDGNGDINGKEVPGAFISPNTHVFNTSKNSRAQAYTFNVSRFSNDSLLSLDFDMISNFPGLNLGDIKLGVYIDKNGQRLFDTITISGSALAAGKAVGFVKTVGLENVSADFNISLFTNDFLSNDTVFYSYTQTNGNSIAENDKKLQVISVYPNPAIDNITVRLPQSFNCSQPNIQLFDMQGRELEIPLKNQISNKEYYITTSSIPPGRYLLTCQCNNKHFGTLLNIQQ
ncbi:MAG: T9SS type A sorting domain-containing protein [Bacteroidia bacterium]